MDIYEPFAQALANYQSTAPGAFLGWMVEGPDIEGAFFRGGATWTQGTAYALAHTELTVTVCLLGTTYNEAVGWAVQRGGSAFTP